MLQLHYLSIILRTCSLISKKKDYFSLANSRECALARRAENKRNFFKILANSILLEDGSSRRSRESAVSERGTARPARPLRARFLRASHLRSRSWRGRRETGCCSVFVCSRAHWKSRLKLVKRLDVKLRWTILRRRCEGMKCGNSCTDADSTKRLTFVF